MQVWQAIVLGAVQGFTEFLPISSSGHLILFQRWFGLKENLIFYSVMLHIGTLIPVVAVLWKEILSLFKKPFGKLFRLVIATVPAGVVGIIFSICFDLDALFSERLWLLSLTFLFTAAEMLFSEYRSKKYSAANNPVSLKTAFVMGCGQAVGVFPGISRSGTTVTAGCIMKTDRAENANFTFLMSIPIILAAVATEGYGCVKGGVGGVEVLPLVFGIVTAAVCGYVSISFMLSVIRKANYKWFSVYLVLISSATLITYFAGV